MWMDCVNPRFPSTLPHVGYIVNLEILQMVLELTTTQAQVCHYGVNIQDSEQLLICHYYNIFGIWLYRGYYQCEWTLYYYVVKFISLNVYS